MELVTDDPENLNLYGGTQSHHGVNRSWMAAIFGSLYSSSQADTVLMPLQNHRRTTGRFPSASNWQRDASWQQILERAERDFNLSETPTNCRDEYWRRFREHARRLVCELLWQRFQEGVATVTPLLQRALEVYDWLSGSDIDVCAPRNGNNLNLYAGSLGRLSP